jgi:hypothetical protein
MRHIITLLLVFNFRFCCGQNENTDHPEILFQLGHAKRILSINFSPDGKLMATMDEQNILIWDVEKFFVIKKINTMGEAGEIEFTPDNKFIITSRNVFNIETGKSEKENYSITNPNLKITIVKNIPVYIFIKKNELLIQNGYNGNNIKQLKLGEYPDLNLTCESKITPDGNYLINPLKEKNVEGEKYALQVWDLATGVMKYCFKGNSGRIRKFEYSKENQFLYSLDTSNIIKCWSLKTAKLIFEISSMNGYSDYNGTFHSINLLTYINSFILSNDEKTIFVSLLDKDSIYSYDALTGKRTDFIIDKSKSTFGKIIAINPTGKILSVASDNKLALYSVLDKSLIYTTLEPLNEVYNFKLCSNSGKFISNDSKGIRVWDFGNPLNISASWASNRSTGTIVVSPRQNKVAIGGGFDKPIIFKIDSLPRINLLFKDEFTTPTFLGEDSVVFYGKKTTFNVTDSEYVDIINNYGKTLKHFILPSKDYEFKYILFNNNKNLLFFKNRPLEKDGFLGSLDLENGNISYDFLPNKKIIYDLQTLNNGKTVIMVSDSIEFWNTRSWKKEKIISETNGFNFNREGKLLVDESSDDLIYDSYLMDEITIWSIRTGSIKKKYHLKDRGFRLVELVKKNNKFKYIGIDDNGRIKFYDGTFNEVATLFCYGISDFMIITPDLFYLCSKPFLAQNILFKYDQKMYSFEDIDIKYNRPEIVLKRLGFTKDSIIDLCKEAYLKRINRLGDSLTTINYTNIDQPEIKILNSKEINSFFPNPQINLKIQAYDSNSTLENFQLFVNGVPLYGKNGLKINNKNIFETETEVRLNNGKNKIQVFVTNSAGVRSERKFLNINYKSDYKPNLYFIGIGVSKYKNIERLPNVDNDIRDFAKILSESGNPFYNKVLIDTMINENAVQINFENLKSELLQTNVDDAVILYYSGHGRLDEHKDLYMATYDFDFSKSNKGILYDDMIKLFDSIPARKRLILLNACQSGEYDEKKGIINILNILFADIGKSTGTTIIASSAWNEYSYSSNTYRNSDFGRAIIAGLTEQKEKFINKHLAADLNEDGIIDVLEFKEFIEKKVASISLKKQNPFTRNENDEMVFRIL